MAGIDTTPGASFPGPTIQNGLTGAAALDWLVRNVVLPSVIDARNKKVKLLGMLYKRVRKSHGKWTIRTVRDGRNFSGISAIHPDGDMPDPGSQGAYAYATFVRDIYARMKIDAKLLRHAEGDMAAIVDPLVYETEGLKDDLSIKQEIMLHSDGSGRRAMVAAGFTAGATTPITVGHNTDTESYTTITTAPTFWLGVGMRIAFMSAAGVVRSTVGGVQGFYVVSIPSTNTFEVSTTLNGTAINSNTITALAAGDWICDAARSDSLPSGTSLGYTSQAYQSTAWRAEPMGLDGVFRDVGVLDGTGISVAGQQTGAPNYTATSITDVATGFQGVQVNSGALSSMPYAAPSWNKAIIIDGAGASVSDSVLQQAHSDSMEINNGTVKMLLSAFAIYNAYVQTLIGDKRFNSNQLSGGHAGFENGMGGIPFNGLPWHLSRYMQGNRVLFLDPDCFGIDENEPLRPAQPPGAPQYQWLQNKDKFWAAWVTSYQFVLDDVRNRAGAMLVNVV